MSIFIAFSASSDRDPFCLKFLHLNVDNVKLLPYLEWIQRIMPCDHPNLNIISNENW